MADLGDTLRFSSDLRDSTGTLANAVSVTLTILLPDGTTTSPTVTNPPVVTGQYVYDYVTTLASPAGRYKGQWLFTLSGGNTTSYVETFDVGPSLVTVDEALAHLRAAGIVEAANDLEQLQWLTLVATDAVERDLDRAITRRTVTEVHNGTSAIVLRKSPVISVTSVTVAGALQLAADYLLDASSAILYRAGGSWWHGFQNVVVVYEAGYVNPPPIVRKVALNAVQGMWQSSQQAAHPFFEGQDGDQSVFAATSSLTEVERRAYDSLRAPAIA